MGGNFKFQVQDSFWEYFILEIWRVRKRIKLSDKKPPLALICPPDFQTFYWLWKGLNRKENFHIRYDAFNHFYKAQE